MKHKPAADQANLFQDRTRLIRLLRNLTCLKTPTQKLMLMVLDAYIGRYASIKLGIDLLAEKCIISPQSAYRLKDELTEIGLLVAKSAGSRVFEFSLGWARMAALEDELAEETAETDEALEESDTPVGAGAVRLTHENSRLAGETSHLVGKTALLAGKKSHLAHEKSHLVGKTEILTSKAHIRNIDLTSTLASNSSSSSSTVGVDREAVVMMAKSCGVGEAEPTIDAALAAGSTPDQIAAVLDHFSTHPGRWPVGVLVHRLTKPGAHRDAPDQGWFGETAEWKAGQRRAAEVAATKADQDRETALVAKDERWELVETIYGPILDAMNDDDRLALLADRPFLARTARATKDFHRSKLYRRSLLDALQARGQEAAALQQPQSREESSQ